MMPTVLFAAPDLWDAYHAPLTKALADAGLHARLVQDDDPGTVDYIVYAPSAPLQDFSPYIRCKAVLNLWAGVERVTGNPTLTQTLCRMVDPGLTEGMVEWVVGHTLRHHLGMDRHIVNPAHLWNPVCPPLARDRTVTVLGLGALGGACARALSALNFPVTGWSRSPRNLPGIRCLSGPDGLTLALHGAQTVITLLPCTPGTDSILNEQTMALPARGAVVLNPGRGPLIDDDALIAALNSGQIGHATLDVFRTEPLPRDHPFWTHPQITVTPHISATTRAPSASAVIAENIRRGQAGEPFLHVVDRDAGY